MGIAVADDDVESDGFQQRCAKGVGVRSARGGHAGDSFESRPVAGGFGSAFVLGCRRKAEHLAEVLLVCAYAGWAAIVTSDDDGFAVSEHGESRVCRCQARGPCDV